MRQDIKIKRAKYIEKNNELYQEFFFFHPKTRLKLNVIYNSHFTGSQLWDMFSREAEMIENTWNTSFRIMYELPLETHRYFVESVSGVPHARTLLYRRFLGFVSQIEQSHKSLPKQLLETIQRDTRSTTGRNLRKLMFVANKDNISLLNKNEEKFGIYTPVLPENKWKVNIVKEMTDVRFGNLQVENFSLEEIEEMQGFLCSS